MVKTLIVTSKVREIIAEDKMNLGLGTTQKIENQVLIIIEKAKTRALKNGRTTVMERDI